MSDEDHKPYLIWNEQYHEEPPWYGIAVQVAPSNYRFLVEAARWYEIKASWSLPFYPSKWFYRLKFYRIAHLVERVESRIMLWRLTRQDHRRALERERR